MGTSVLENNPSPAASDILEGAKQVILSSQASLIRSCPPNWVAVEGQYFSLSPSSLVNFNINCPLLLILLELQGGTILKLQVIEYHKQNHKKLLHGTFMASKMSNSLTIAGLAQQRGFSVKIFHLLTQTSPEPFDHLQRCLKVYHNQWLTIIYQNLLKK